MPHSDLYMIYCPCESNEQAREIAMFLIKNKYAACCNISSQVQSLYEWKGQIEESQEVILIAKTETSKREDCMKQIESMHSYERSCVLAWPIEYANEAFNDWVMSQ